MFVLFTADAALRMPCLKSRRFRSSSDVLYPLSLYYSCTSTVVPRLIGCIEIVTEVYVHSRKNDCSENDSSTLAFVISVNWSIFDLQLNQLQWLTVVSAVSYVHDTAFLGFWSTELHNIAVTESITGTLQFISGRRFDGRFMRTFIHMHKCTTQWLSDLIWYVFEVMRSNSSVLTDNDYV